MNKNIALVSLLLILVISCGKERGLEIIAGSITENDFEACKNDDCPEITINYLEASGDTDVAEKITGKIKDYIISSLQIGEEKPKPAETVEEAVNQFIEFYRRDKQQFATMAAEYVAEISVTELYNSPSLICFELHQYLYTGGAHGYGTIRFLNIDPRTGDEISEEQIFKDRDAFIGFAEKKFRAQQNIAPNTSLNEPGFWFEDDTFYLPSTVGITQDTLIFVYNQYDIASYAAGPIELKIAKAEAAKYLNEIPK